MPETANQQFKIVAKITKHYLRKDANGVEKTVLEGMASNTNIDLTGERMADSAVIAMAKSLESNKVLLNNEHGSDWDDDFGEVTKLWVNDDHELMMEAELDSDHYRTQTLIKSLDKGKQLGLSIGGIVLDAAMEWFADLGRKVMTYKDISLFHIAITGTPAVADTWVTPITKSVKSVIDGKETPMPTKEIKKAVEAVEDLNVEEVADAIASGDVTSDEGVETIPVEEETSVVPADGEEPEAAKSESNESTVEAPAESEETPGTETEAPEAEAAAEEVDAPASAETAPEQAESLEAEVEIIPETEAPAEVEEAQKAQTSATAEVEQLAKSLNDAQSQIQMLTKSLADTETKLEASEADVARRDDELEDVRKTLEETEKQITIIKGRKAFAMGKFGELESLEEAQKSEGKVSVMDIMMKEIMGTNTERTA